MKNEARAQNASIAAVQASNVDFTAHVDHRFRYQGTV